MYKLYCDKSKLSIGQLYLLDFCDKRELTKFWSENLHRRFTVGYLMKIATGKYQIPSLNFIYTMLNYVKMAPTDWFYTKQETEGKEADFHFKENYVTDIRQSKNYQRIEKIHKNKELRKFCEENFFEESRHYYVNFLHILSGRNSVSSVFIKKLQNVFPIADWFIN